MPTNGDACVSSLRIGEIVRLTCYFRVTLVRLRWEFFHKTFGRLALVLAIANIFLGIRILESFHGTPKTTSQTMIITQGVIVILLVATAVCTLVAKKRRELSRPPSSNSMKLDSTETFYEPSEEHQSGHV